LLIEKPELPAAGLFNQQSTIINQQFFP